jgi:hypothetical protein
MRTCQAPGSADWVGIRPNAAPFPAGHLAGKTIQETLWSRRGRNPFRGLSKFEEELKFAGSNICRYNRADGNTHQVHPGVVLVLSTRTLQG